jgi:predicted site-specific integrase-resolvase
VNLPEWADRVGVPKFTACRWFRVGTLRVPAGRAGRLILVSAGVAKREPARAVLDARVWPDGRRGGLGRRVARLAGWAAGQGVAAAGVAAGAGPG